MMTIAVVDYGAGNINSVVKAFRYLGAGVRVIQVPQETREAERLVLPGVGAFGPASEAIRAAGLFPVLRDWIDEERPFLGICLGMQLMMEGSDERPEAEGLGVMRGGCRRFEGERVPQMGWNNIHMIQSSSLLHGLTERDYFYFVHSYYVDPDDGESVVGRTEFNRAFASVVRKRRAWGVQFHPEKSGGAGLALLKNWMERC